jgi:hypothetical protein
VAKKLAPKGTGKVNPVNHKEVNSSYVVEKNNYGDKEVIKEKGTDIAEPEDAYSNPALSLPAGMTTVGLSKGLTLNLGSYQSARINCWISKTIGSDDEKSIMDALADISQLIDEQIEFESNEILENNEK